MKRLLFALFLFSPLIHAENIYIVPHGADGREVVDVYREDETGWQTRIEHHVFATKASMRRALSGIEKRFGGRVRPARPFAARENRILTGGGTEIWPVTEAWSTAWERRYSRWMSENFTPTFFSEHGLATDCADVPVTMRWIFAREHGLPAANHASGSGRLITQSSFPASWAGYPTSANWWEDERFLRALRHVQANVDTTSLFEDLYPVGIDMDALAPGAVWLMRSEHTYNVGVLDLRTSDWMVLYSSTVPAQVRDLMSTTFSGFDRPTADYDGFRRHRWARATVDGWELAPAEEMPWYSDEEFGDEFMDGENDFAAAVYERLAGQVLSPEVRLANLYRNLRARLLLRNTIVSQGYRRCYPDGCPRGSAAYEEWSTPSRDRHVSEVLHKIDGLLALSPSLAPGWDARRGEYLFWSWMDRDYRTHSFFLGELLDVWRAGRFTSDPNDSMYKRWGLP